MRRDYDLALADLDEAIRIDPSRASFYFYRGVIYSYRGDLDKAIADYTTATRLAPQIASGYFYRSLDYLRKEEVDSAVSDLSEAIRLDPSQAGVFNARGRAYSKIDRYEEAISDWTEALRLDENNAEAMGNLCWLLITCSDRRLRNAERALELGEKLVRLAPNHPRAWGHLGAARCAARKPRSAIEALRKSIELNHPENVYNWLFLAGAHWQLNEREEARKWYDKAAGGNEVHKTLARRQAVSPAT